MSVKACCERGDHVYKAIWAAGFKEELVCDSGFNNERDRCLSSDNEPHASSMDPSLPLPLSLYFIFY